MSSFSTKKPSGESRESSSERSTRKKVVADDQGKPKYVSYPPETEQKNIEKSQRKKKFVKKADMTFDSQAETKENELIDDMSKNSRINLEEFKFFKTGAEQLEIPPPKQSKKERKLLEENKEMLEKQKKEQSTKAVLLQSQSALPAHSSSEIIEDIQDVTDFFVPPSPKKVFSKAAMRQLADQLRVINPSTEKKKFYEKIGLEVPFLEDDDIVDLEEKKVEVQSSIASESLLTEMNSSTAQRQSLESIEPGLLQSVSNSTTLVPAVNVMEIESRKNEEPKEVDQKNLSVELSDLSEHDEEVGQKVNRLRNLRTQDQLYHRSRNFGRSLFLPPSSLESANFEEQWYEANKKKALLYTLAELREFDNWLGDEPSKGNDTKILNISSILFRLLEQHPEGLDLITSFKTQLNELYRDDCNAFLSYIHDVPFDALHIEVIENIALNQLINAQSEASHFLSTQDALVKLRISVAQQKAATFFFRVLRKTMCKVNYENRVHFGEVVSNKAYFEPKRPAPDQEEWFWPNASNHSKNLSRIRDELSEGGEDCEYRINNTLQDKRTSAHPDLPLELKKSRRTNFMLSHQVIWDELTKSFVLNNIANSTLPVVNGSIYTRANTGFSLDLTHLHCFDPFLEFNNIGSQTPMIKAHNRGAVYLEPGCRIIYNPELKFFEEALSTAAEGIDWKEISKADQSLLLQELNLEFETSPSILHSTNPRPIQGEPPKAQIHLFDTKLPSLEPSSIIMHSAVKSFSNQQIFGTRDPFLLNVNIDWTEKCLHNPSLEEQFYSKLIGGQSNFFFPIPQLSLSNFTEEDSWSLTWNWSALIGKPLHLSYLLLAQKLLSLTNQNIKQQILKLQLYAEAEDLCAKKLLEEYIMKLDL